MLPGRLIVGSGSISSAFISGLTFYCDIFVIISPVNNFLVKIWNFCLALAKIGKFLLRNLKNLQKEHLARKILLDTGDCLK